MVVKLKRTYLNETALVEEYEIAEYNWRFITAEVTTLIQP